MEQRIDPKIQTEFAAGTDPAYIPGLVAPAPPKPAGKEPGRAGDETEEPAADEAAAPATAEEGEEQPEAERRPEERDAPGERDEDDEHDERDPAAEKKPAEKDPAEDGTEDSPADGPEDGPGDGPVFEVSDRRGSITADREGVRFRLDDQEAEFDWDEIGAVEVKTPRFGRRFTVTVHISSRRWFDAEVEAPAKNLLKQWEADLDEVLDAYFEES
ncbi:hypothetical protein AB0P17_15185 [Streptomyces sp. NPDC088124]|uniref:hypothetical protein n=1 Tax=Streptomyces sp. NPDC088124 TaxID=3154654 RepID=UPI003432EF4A